MARKDSDNRKKSMSRPFTKKYVDPAAPYDGYAEDDDTQKSARTALLGKVGMK